MDTKEVKFEYNLGIHEPRTVEEQLNEQGLSLGKSAELVEKLRKSFHLFRFHIFTDSEATRALKKIQKIVEKSVVAK